jgi:cytochrome c biogenesis protein CcmG/thiol:disulfide interchange protein DsbE
MKFKSIILCGIIVVAAVLIYGGLRRSKAGESQAVTLSSTNLQNKKSPDFELKSLDGRTVKLSDFRGKAVLLNFWATYCGPCRVEMPWLRDIYKQYQAQGLEIVGVSMDDDGEKQQVTDFVREINVNYTILMGNHSVGDAYGGARFLPQTFFIDRDGKVTGSAVGMKGKTEFENAVKQLLAAAH